MKRFYFSLISAITVLSTWACFGSSPTHNFYMFSLINRDVYNTDDESSSTDWDKYIGTKCSYEDDLSDVDLNKFNKSKNRIVQTAIKRKDTETINYLKFIIEYSQNNGERDSWDYPTKKQLAQRKVILNKIKKAAMAYKGTRYKNQYAFLVMRCNMTLKEHQSNVNFWEKVASKLKSNEFKPEMKNIYAGALYNLGQRDKACDIFVEMGDMTSIKYCVRKDRNLKGIKEQYAQNPNRPTLTFLVQDFVNNTQESIDDNYDSEEADFLGTKVIRKQEAMNFAVFAKHVLDEGKTKSPAMWEAARGFINYLYNNYDLAVKQLTHATQLAGTQRMKDNARACLALAKTHNAKPTNEFFDYLLGEFKWMQNKSGKSRIVNEWGATEYTYVDQHYQEVLHRIAITELAPHFKDWNMPEAALATHCMVDSLDGNNFMDVWAWGGNAKNYIDSISSAELGKFYSYLNKNGVSKLEKWINSHAIGEDEYNDLMGTKLIRENKCERAIPYLEKVPLKYYSTLGISAYMNQRDYKNKERWVKRQVKTAKPENEEEWQDKFDVSRNDKLDFCRDIIDINQQIDKAQGEKKLELLYKKASMLFQASFYGDCWYISHYYTSDYLAPSSADILADQAMNLLKNVELSTSNQRMKLKSKYAQTYIIGETEDWCFEQVLVNNDYVTVLNRNTNHYSAMHKLSNFINQNGAYDLAYISKCDILKSFREYDNSLK